MPNWATQGGAKQTNRSARELLVKKTIKRSRSKYNLSALLRSFVSSKILVLLSVHITQRMANKAYLHGHTYYPAKTLKSSDQHICDPSQSHPAIAAIAKRNCQRSQVSRPWRNKWSIASSFFLYSSVLMAWKGPKSYTCHWYSLHVRHYPCKTFSFKEGLGYHISLAEKNRLVIFHVVIEKVIEAYAFYSLNIK